MYEILEQIYFGNTVREYLYFLAVFALSIAIITVIRYIIIKRIKARAELNVKSAYDILINSTKKYLIPLMYFASFYVSIELLTIYPTLRRVIDFAALAVVTIYSAVIIISLIEYSFHKYKIKACLDSNKSIIFDWIKRILKVAVWVATIIIFIQNLGVNINSIIAGLGIGGIAIAFAAQSILEDVFSYFSIYFDRPFEVGDFITFGEHMGTVQHVGIKTTRLRSIGGEQLILSNKDLTRSSVRNFKKMEERRVLFSLGVTYNTSLEQLKKIPESIRNIIERQEDTRFDRAHFFTFADSSFRFEVVYFVLSNQFIKYMDIQQNINFMIKEEFERLGIEFAFPTQTIHLQSSNFIR